MEPILSDVIVGGGVLGLALLILVIVAIVFLARRA